jgi:hypothetical protein
MRLFLFAIALVVAVLGCSDGKLNLLLVFWGDSEESSSSRERIQDDPKSSSSVTILGSSNSTSSSSVIKSCSSGEQPLSSNEEQPSLSSSNEPSPLSSSSGRVRSSSSKGYEDYPVLEEGAKDVQRGWATRYWDGCKPHCSWLGNIVDTKNPKPWNGICKNCDKNNKEVTTYQKHPSWTDGLYWAGYLSVPSSCNDPSGTYACWDMAPIAINDTLAYGFAAMNPEIAECGTCYQLNFDGYWYDEPQMPRPTHRAIKGKTMIVMASNIGGDVKYNVEMKDGKKGTQFDIMIPGGGVGAFNSFSDQLGLTVQDMGVGFGGLLSNCIEKGLAGMDIRDGSHRATLEQWQECLRNECERVFSGKAKELYNGCIWHVNWFMAADNPTLYYKKVECPKYLKDKYYSSIDLEPPPLPDPYPINGLCMIEGSVDCKQTGWY